jgi:uncharacterized protein (TIGR02217 family)
MTIPLFPTLPGLGWSSTKRPTASTRIATHVSGREVRSANYAYPLYEFEVLFELLRSGAAQELETLMGFFLQCQGQFGVFRFVDPSDNAVTGQTLGVGDGVTTSFAAVRGIGGWVEPVGYLEGASRVALAGVTQTAGWSITAPAVITFAGAPAAGIAVTADFTFSYLCRFLDDKQSFEQFMAGLWANKSLKFRSVRSA